MISLLQRFWQHSFIFRVFCLGDHFWKRVSQHSAVAKAFHSFSSYTRVIIANSQAIKYFTKPRNCFDEAFENYFWGKLIRPLGLGFVSKMLTLIQQSFQGSLSHRFIKSIEKDIQQGSIRYLAFFFFAFLSIRVSLELIFGKGYPREAIIIYFLLLSFCWFLTYSRIPLFWFYKHSYFVKFIKGLIS